MKLIKSLFVLTLTAMVMVSCGDAKKEAPAAEEAVEVTEEKAAEAAAEVTEGAEEVAADAEAAVDSLSAETEKAVDTAKAIAEATEKK